MAEVTTAVKFEGIQEIARQIVERFQPQKIFLFGSHASGATTEDSDVDLLVVMEGDKQPLHLAAQVAAAVDHPFPLDILVFKPSEWEASLKRKGVFATEVMAKGVILYEA